MKTFNIIVVDDDFPDDAIFNQSLKASSEHVALRYALEALEEKFFMKRFDSYTIYLRRLT
jgi:hypothetical protein